MEWTFDTWVRYVFDRPVADRAWYWTEESVEEPPADQALDFLTRLFADPLPAVGRYSDAQLNQAFWYLPFNGASGYSAVLFDGGLWPRSRDALRAVGDLYAKLFAARCTPHLSHRDEPGCGPLNSACYMWWDTLPTGLARHGPDRPHAAALDAEVLAVLRRTLALDSVACQEAALHGLGHWHLYYPAGVETIVDAFVAARPSLRPELARYAACARTGYVQ
jgi:hypothetical protein